MVSEEEIEREKQRAAAVAAELVEDGMTVGLGTGSTAAYLLEPLAARKLNIRCVATSPSTAQAARVMGIEVVSFAGLEAPPRVDITIDGADQVDPSGWLIKGGGGAHTREKAVAASADRFVVIVSANKLVDRLTPPVPLELAEFLSQMPGVVEHGLFPPDMVADVLVGRGDEVERIAVAGRG